MLANILLKKFFDAEIYEEEYVATFFAGMTKKKKWQD